MYACMAITYNESLQSFCTCILMAQYLVAEYNPVGIHKNTGQHLSLGEILVFTL